MAAPDRVRYGLTKVTSSKPARPAPPADPRHRQAPQAKVEDMLLLAGFDLEGAGERETEARTAIQESLRRCVAAGLGFRRDQNGQRTFDPAEVMNFIIWASCCGLDDLWIRRIVATGRSRAMELDEASRSGARFRAVWRRRFDLRSRERAGEGCRLRLPLPLAAAHPGVLRITPAMAPDLDAQVRIYDGRMDVRLSHIPPGEATIGADVEFETPPLDAALNPPPLGAAEIELYLRPVEGLIHITPRVLELARRLAIPRDPFRTAHAIWNHMIHDLGFGVVRYDEVPAQAAGDWILDRGVYDCQIGAALLISLCRASGIPARMVSGQFLYRHAPLSHFWAEVWIDGRGWLAFDFIAWGLSAAGADPRWLDRFGGRSEPRMITQRLPLAFTGPMSVRFPAAWQMLQTAAARGVDITYTDISDGALIYRDHIAVERLG